MGGKIFSVGELDGDAREATRAAFAGLARAQRGLPEAMAVSMRANPGLFNATGAFTYLAEHVGDLTHRLTEGGGEWCGFGCSTVWEKVSRALRYFRNGHGLAREMETNLRNNHTCREEDGRTTLTLAEFTAEFAKGAKRYADAHAALPVWNEAQWHAREAAVALGRHDHRELKRHLEALEARLLLGRDSWELWAGEVTLRDGLPVPFEDSLVRDRETRKQLSAPGFQ